MKERPSFSPRVVLGALGFSLLLSLGFGRFVYTRFIRFEPRALGETRADAKLLVWVHVEQAVVYQPFRNAFVPLLEAERKGAEMRLLELERKTTLELGVDTREAVLALGPAPTDWSFVLGGLFRRDGVVSGVARLLEGEGRAPSLVGATEALRLGPTAYFRVDPAGTLRLSNLPEPATGARASQRLQAPHHLALAWLQTAAFPGADLPAAQVRLEVEARDNFPFRITVSGTPDQRRAFAGAPGELLVPAQAALARAQASAAESAEGEQLLLRGELSRAEFEGVLYSVAGLLRRTAGPGFDPGHSAR